MDRAVADQIPAGLVEVDADDRIVTVNSVVAGWAGVDGAKLAGRDFVSVVRSPPPPSSPDLEYLPAVAEIFNPDGICLPVLVAEGTAGPDGRRYITLFDATEQRAFRERLQSRHGLTQRTQSRLELVIQSSIAFAEATSEEELATVLAATTASAYAAEEAVVFLLDENGRFQHVAGANPFVNVSDLSILTAQAHELRSVVKISGRAAAHALSPAVGDAFEATGVQSMIIAPIRVRNELLGILAAFFHHPREFDDQASPLADALAGQAARAVSGLRLQARLEHQALHDDTTGLPNRRRLEEWTDRSREPGSAVLGVLFVDLDGFKAINDRLGHHVGDDLLRDVAGRLRDAVRDGDIVARYGGDEFVIICEVASEGAAIEMAERVRDIVQQPYANLPTGAMVGASIGVAVTDAVGSVGIDQLVRAADQAMYRAKYAGGNQIAMAGR